MVQKNKCNRVVCYDANENNVNVNFLQSEKQTNDTRIITFVINALNISVLQHIN